ncbi:MAG TPA: hypothetical protein VM101_13490, partial [Flavitalea sp.]|nr:hypothetical protein [Flavitalea sp.]
QILYWTPKPGVYPKSRFDAVFDNAQTQAEIGVFQVSGIQNRFSAQHIFKYPGRFEDEKKKNEFIDKLHELQGASANGKTLVVEDPAGEQGQESHLIESIQMQNTDKMYEFTSKDARNSIRETLAVPAPILGQLPEGGMFNQEQIEDSYKYMNAMTQGDRDQLERIFKKILTYWHQPVSFSSFKIKLVQYGVTTSQSATIPGQAPQPGQPGATAQTEPRKIDPGLSKLSAAESANMERIIRKVKKGKIDRAAGIALIKMSFGFSDEEAKSFIP